MRKTSSKANSLRFTPEKTNVLSRQKRILSQDGIIEVAQDMYSRNVELE